MQQKWKSEPLCFLHPEPKKFVKNKLFPQSTKYEARTFVAYFWTSVHGGTAAAEASNSTLGLPQAWKKWSEFFSLSSTPIITAIVPVVKKKRA